MRSEVIKSLNFIHLLQRKSSEGEIPVAIIGSLLSNLSSESITNWNVVVHPVNQSGASSKEYSDIDVFQNKQLLFGNEIKDKNFSIEDVTHACEKLIKKNAYKLNFVFGMNAHKTPSNVDKLISKYKSDGFILNMLSLPDYISWLLTLTANLSCNNIFEKIIQISEDARFKEETKRHIIETARSISLIK